MIWVDETYIDYVAGAKSLESLTQSHEELIICKSMSKCYALSDCVLLMQSQVAQNLRLYSTMGSESTGPVRVSDS